MEKLKVALSVIRKHHFWFLCGLILIVYLAVWFRSTSVMTAQALARAGLINTAFSTGEKIVEIHNHPNTQSVEMMKELNREEGEQVRHAWENRFREQEDVLVWPEELLPDFIAAVEPLKPIELKVDFPTPPTQELKMEFRNRYRDYIRRELPKLAEIIGAEWRADQQAGAGLGDMEMGMMGGMRPRGGMTGEMPRISGLGERFGGTPSPYGGAVTVEESPIVVDWATSSQAAILSSCFNWTSPTTLQVLYAQEDLWVLRALMLIIKATNGDADAQYNAAVKEIVTLHLGAMAGGLKGGDTGGIGAMRDMGTMGGAGGARQAMAAMEERGAASVQVGASRTGPSSTSAAASARGAARDGAGAGLGGAAASLAGAAGADLDPADNRYVDGQTEPLTGERLRTALKSEQSADAFLAVAKRMPVRMRVRMNILRLPLFLSQCAKSNLPVEVRQVQINPTTGGGDRTMGSGFLAASGAVDASSMMGRGGARGMSMDEMPHGMGSMMGGSPAQFGARGAWSGVGAGSLGGAGRGAMDGPGRSGPLGSDSPYDATVEIYGVIYIYNPVNPTQLGLDTAVAWLSATEFPAKATATAAASGNPARPTDAENTASGDSP